MANTKITTNVIADDAITTAKIADDAVGNDQLASGLTLGGNTAATLSTAAQPNITSLGTLTALTIDDITIDGSTLTDAGDFEIDVGGNIILDADGGGIYFQDGSTLIGSLQNSSSDFVISNEVADKDIVFKGIDGSSTITAMTIDMSEGGNVLIGATTSSLPSSGTPGLEVAGSGFAGMAAVTRFDNNAYGPSLFLVKSRAANASSHTIVADDDNLGAINWTPDDGTNRDTYAASIAAKVDGTPGANDMPARLEFMTTADGAASPTTRMTILNGGNVGIGNDNPADRLVVQKDTTSIEPILVIKNDNTTADNGTSIDFSGKDTSGNNVLFGRIATKYTNHNTEKSHMIFSHRNDSGSFAEWMRVTHDGKVGIGIASPGGLPFQTKVSSGDNKLRQTTANKDAFTLGLDDSTGDTIIGTHSKYPHTTFRDGGNVEIADGNVYLAAGHGIDFGATTNSGGNLGTELLNDYEDGTWTPILIAGTTNPTGGGAISPQGRYTKIGNRVWVTFYVGRSWTNTPAGGIYISNLPYTIHASTNQYYSAAVVGYNIDGSDSLFIVPNVNSTNLQLYASANNGAWATVNWTTHTSGTIIYVSGTFSYHV